MKIKLENFFYDKKYIRCNPLTAVINPLNVEIVNVSNLTWYESSQIQVKKFFGKGYKTKEVLTRYEGNKQLFRVVLTSGAMYRTFDKATLVKYKLWED